LTQRLQLGKKYENHDLIFASGTGAPLRFRSLTRHLGQIMKKTKIDGPINLYRLRHSFVTLALLSGADDAQPFITRQASKNRFQEN
jgi:site-specific recombinase XerD